MLTQLPILPFKNVNNQEKLYRGRKPGCSLLTGLLKKEHPEFLSLWMKDAISTSELVLMISENLGKKTILFKIPEFIVKLGMSVFPKIFDRLYGSFEMDNSDTLKVP